MGQPCYDEAFVSSSVDQLTATITFTANGQTLCGGPQALQPYSIFDVTYHYAHCDTSFAETGAETVTATYNGDTANANGDRHSHLPGPARFDLDGRVGLGTRPRWWESR